MTYPAGTLFACQTCGRMLYRLAVAGPVSARHLEPSEGVAAPEAGQEIACPDCGVADLVILAPE